MLIRSSHADSRRFRASRTGKNLTDDVARMSWQVSAHSAIVGWNRVLMMYRVLRNDIDGQTVIAKIHLENLARSFPDLCLPPLTPQDN
jgi:hypothetical protein